MTQLPAGWCKTTVGKVSEKIRGVSYAKNEALQHEKEGLVPIVRANNIADDRITYKDLIFVPIGRVAPRQRLLANDVIVAMSSGSKRVVGKTAQVTEDWAGSFGAFCGVLRPRVEIDGRFFGYFFRTEEYRLKISELAVGTNINNLKNEHFEQFDFLLPPLNEQRRIVEKLQKLLSRVNAAQERLATIPRILKRFRQSVLAFACSGRLTADWRGPRGTLNENDPFNGIPNTWSKTKLSDVAGVVDPNPSHRYPSYKNGCIPILSTQEFSGLDNWDIRTAKLVPIAFYEERNNANGFCADDIIFARKGRLGLARRPPKIPRYTFSHTIFLVRANERVSSDYLLWYLRQDVCVSWLLTEMNSNTGVPTLGKAFLQRLPVKVPPRDEQQEIVRRVEALFKTADELEARYLKAKAHVDRLTQSILAKAFRGELVPQDPNDEPASVLLERITAERNGSPR